MNLRYDLERSELAPLLAGEPRYRLDQVWHALYHHDRDLSQASNVPGRLRDRLVAELPMGLEPEVRSVGDDGDTVKWMWRLRDGHRVETVLMYYDDRATVCVSSQAGCAMGCGFCATGQVGFDRHLSVGEIVEQVIRARQEAAPRRLSNVVFMGMGEPLANYERTWAAIERIHADIGLSARRITVSTVGIVPGIERLAAENLPVNLAVSLHAANDERRNELVPINRQYPLGRLISACERYLEAGGRRISIEWALIQGMNDQARDAAELAEVSRRLRAHVNLIPLNPTPRFGVPGTDAAGIRAFASQLRALGLNATVRRNRGVGIDAACGQLRVTRSG